MKELLIKKLKGTEYIVEQNLSMYEWSVTIKYRVAQLIRGLLCYFFFSKKGLLFIGKSVTIKYGRYLKLGKNCIIEDFVEINALSEKGIIFDDNVTIARGSTIIGPGGVRDKGLGIKI